MIEHHFVVVHNADTGSWYMDSSLLTDGPIYDTSLGKFRHATPEEAEKDWELSGYLEQALIKLSNETEKP